MVIERLGMKSSVGSRRTLRDAIGIWQPEHIPRPHLPNYSPAAMTLHPPPLKHASIVAIFCHIFDGIGDTVQATKNATTS